MRYLTSFSTRGDIWRFVHREFSFAASLRRTRARQIAFASDTIVRRVPVHIVTSDRSTSRTWCCRNAVPSVSARTHCTNVKRMYEFNNQFATSFVGASLPYTPRLDRQNNTNAINTQSVLKSYPRFNTARGIIFKRHPSARPETDKESSVSRVFTKLLKPKYIYTLHHGEKTRRLFVIINTTGGPGCSVRF